MKLYIVGGIIIFYLLSITGAEVLGYRYSSALCRAADAKHDLAQADNTIAATQKTATEIKQQGNISQEASSNYAKDFNYIGSVYNFDSMREPAHSTINSVPAVRSATSGTCSSVSAKTKVYKLTPEQCDMEEAKANRLWNWATQQATVK